MLYNKLCFKLVKRNHVKVLQNSVRNFRGIKGRCFGKPPGEARSLKELYNKINYKDPKVYYKVDIGLPPPNKGKESLYQKLKALKAVQSEFSKKITENVSLYEIETEWSETEAPYHIKKIADHYSIYQDLFGDAYFFPFVRLQIAYKVKDEEYVPVYRGNIVKPHEAYEEPKVKFNAKLDKFYTLVLCTPDGHLNHENSEYVHWFVGNIPDGDISKGEVIKPYMQPLPTRGTGYFRYVYVLYEHEKPLDYCKLKSVDSKRINLDDRTFATYDFYKLRQDDLTPVGLSFHQSDWDWTVNDFFHKRLCMEEPIFEYDAAELPQNSQTFFPVRHPFNTYMDRYRDPKQVAKEFLLKKFKTHHPFKEPEPPLKYPAAHVAVEGADLPSWKQVELKKEKLGWGVINYHKDMLDPK